MCIIGHKGVKLFITELMDNTKIKSVVKSIIEMIVIIAFVFVFLTYVIIPIRIQGKSMENTLYDENIVFINGLGAINGNVDRFDVVVLNCEALNEKIIKRVIGLPGDHIVYKDDKLYINDELVEQDFLDEEFVEYSKKQYSVSCFTNDFEIDVNENEIFVLGDNRLKSTDSRDLGCFSFDDIIGKEGIVIYPFSNIKWLD